MTVIGIPVINRPDLLVRLLRSIDQDWPIVVIDNSSDSEIAEACEPFDVDLVMPPSNLGVAASWNFVIRTHPSEDWWCMANADAELTPGDLDTLADEMTAGPRWIGMNGDWRVFGINRECVDTVGLFDENFVPCYFEDCDYERRCTLAGVPWGFVSGGATHAGSVAIRSDPRLAAGNARSYPANAAYYGAKWGGTARGGERFATPFDRGGHLGDWRLELSRLRELAWA